MVKYYILNSAVITSPGTYNYVLVNLDFAKEWLRLHDDAIFTIGYEETVNVFNKLFGTNYKPNRQQITMQPNDEALVFRLKIRLSDVQLKGKLGEDFVKQNLEIGLLVRLA